MFCINRFENWEINSSRCWTNANVCKLPEGNKNIFTSKYQLYLPTVEELKQTIEEEKKQIETNTILDKKED